MRARVAGALTLALALVGPALAEEPVAAAGSAGGAAAAGAAGAPGAAATPAAAGAPGTVAAAGSAGAGPWRDPAEIAGAIETCLVEANRDPTAEDACVGQSTASCLDAAGDPTPETAAACTAAEAEGWRLLVVQTAGALVAMAEQLGVGGDGAQALAMAQAQRAWAEYRDADCRQLGALAEPGPVQDGLVAQCRVDRGAERALALLSRRRAMDSP